MDYQSNNVVLHNWGCCMYEPSLTTILSNYEPSSTINSPSIDHHKATVFIASPAMRKWGLHFQNLSGKLPGISGSGAASYRVIAEIVLGIRSENWSGYLLMIQIIQLAWSLPCFCDGMGWALCPTFCEGHRISVLARSFDDLPSKLAIVLLNGWITMNQLLTW